MAGPHERAFLLRDITVSPSTNGISSSSIDRTLQPKVMAVLHCLATNYGSVVSTDEMIDQLWQGRVSAGSVQKSINALRAVLTDFFGDEEVIKNYAKKGYTLQIAPEFIKSTLQPSPLSQQASDAPKEIIVAKTQRVLWPLWLAVFTIALIALFYFTQPFLSEQSKAAHYTAPQAFHSLRGFTSETGHERVAEPHPDNTHVVYIRDYIDTHHADDSESHLIVRNMLGEEWLLSKTTASWFKIAWAPDKQRLLAIEVVRNNGQALTPDFFDKPDYVYNIYLITPDFDKKTAIKKALISQWQGRIFSVSWWDNNTLELTAKQGPYSNNARFHYNIRERMTYELEPLAAPEKILLSKVHAKKTAIASEYNNKINIRIYDENKQLIHAWPFEKQKIDISWMSNGLGLFVIESGQKLHALYLTGEKKEIALNVGKNTVNRWPRNSADGKKIFFTQQKRKSNIWQFSLNGEKHNISNNDNLNYSPMLSHSAKKIAYASLRTNQHQLWLIENSTEKQLTNKNFDKVDTLIWSADDTSLVFKENESIHRLSLSDKSLTTLLKHAKNITPIAYFPKENYLFTTKRINNATNIWRIELKDGSQEQISHGSVGSTISLNKKVYFQYKNKEGLWLLDNKLSPVNIADKLDKNSLILHINEEGVYYLTGGRCRESDLLFLSFSTNIKSQVSLAREKMQWTSSFHPDVGALGGYCYLPESNIILLE